MPFVGGMSPIRAKVKTYKEAVRAKAVGIIRTYAENVLTEALYISPQWSGNYTYNWSLIVDGNKTGYSSLLKVSPWNSVDEPYQQGSMQAITPVEARLPSMLAKIKLESKLSLYNPTPKLGNAIATGSIKLRPENYIPGEQGIIYYIKTQFKHVKDSNGT